MSSTQPPTSYNSLQPISNIVDSIKLDVVSKNNNTLISIKPIGTIQGVTRTPVDVCCVIDVSGSMGEEARINTSGAGTEGYGFSVLDLVKHSVNTIIEALEPQDRLSLVAFTTQATIVLDLIEMNGFGKKRAVKAVEDFRPEASTNLWAGLNTGLEVLRNAKARKNSAILLLTDGMPNVVPPRGHLPMMMKYRSDYGLPGLIHTFGFGYQMDSKLLKELSVLGDGSYSFIPDGSFVGTVFINALANLLSTVGTNVTLGIDLGKCQIRDPLPFRPHVHHLNGNPPTKLEFEFGNVNFGQEKHFLVPLNFLPERKINLEIKYDSPFHDSTIKWSNEYEVRQINDPIVDIHRLRFHMLNQLTDAMAYIDTNRHVEAALVLDRLINEFKTCDVKEEKYIKDLLFELEDQVKLAIMQLPEYMRWGRHYLPSLMGAHLHQQCNNFKDPGVQHYGGQMFQALRDSIELIFLALPPPNPSCVRAGQSYQNVNINMFHNSGNPCFAGDSLVLMADGTSKQVMEVRQGDHIKGPDGQPVKVKCILKTKGSGKSYITSLSGGLKVTPWHPVRFNGKWYFPNQISEAKEIDCPAVYSFVLENQHVMTINGVECVTLGHRFQEEIVKHPYFGTNKVIEDLKNLKGWSDGLVEIRPNYVQRDPKSGLIMGIKKPIIPLPAFNASSMIPNFTSNIARKFLKYIL